MPSATGRIEHVSENTVTHPAPGTQIDVAEVPNLRDLGGWQTADGRTVARGLVYRGTHLNRAAGTPVAELGLGAIVDLRREAERASNPDAPLAPVIVADVFGDRPTEGDIDMVALLADPPALVAATNGLAADEVTRHMTNAYRGFLAPGSATTAFRTLLGTIAHADAPVLFHCSAGKDRTGWGAAVLLQLLGVPLATVERDYLLTNEQFLPALGPGFEAFARHGGDLEMLRAVLGVRLNYLHAALDAMTSAFGDVETYATRGLGLSDDSLTRLRERLLV